MNFDSQMLTESINISMGCFFVSLIMISLDVICLYLKVRTESFLGLNYALRGYLITTLLWSLGAAMLGIIANLVSIFDLENSYNACVISIAVAWPLVFTSIVKRAQTAATTPAPRPQTSSNA